MLLVIGAVPSIDCGVMTADDRCVCMINNDLLFTSCTSALAGGICVDGQQHLNIRFPIIDSNLETHVTD